MTRDDIIRMAREAECSETWGGDAFKFTVDELERFFNLVYEAGAAAERKRLTDADQKCVVLNCTNHRSEGKFEGDLCTPCYVFVSTGKGVYSQAYRNTQLKPLTDEEIDKVTDAQWSRNNHKPIYAAHRAYARAIERAHGIGEKE